MSYNLMVFDPETAPRTRRSFISWFEQQAEWGEDHSYEDPSVSTPQLSAWFMDMIKLFPAMNGPHAEEYDDLDDAKVSDYCVGRSVIYVAFAWSVAESARSTFVELARKHSVGFFDVSSEEGEIVFPDLNL